MLSLSQMFFWFMANSVGSSIKICWHEPWRGKFCVTVNTVVNATVKVHLLVIRRGSETRTQIHWFLLANQQSVIYAGSDWFNTLFWSQMPICVYICAPFFYNWAILVGTKCWSINLLVNHLQFWYFSPLQIASLLVEDSSLL